MINEIAQQALTTGYLTLEAENQLRLLLRTQCDSEELSAFMKLQTAAADGMIRQESRESKCEMPPIGSHRVFVGTHIPVSKSC